ncbi:long-chain fatty acid-CoA ligase, partial [Cladochytrium tenue]
ADWMLMAHAAFTQNFTITTAYDTLGEEGLSYSLNECEVTTLFTNGDLLPIVQKIAPKVKTLKNVVYNGTPSAAVLESLRVNAPHIKLISITELKTFGEKNPSELSLPTASDLACIMYTSGTTVAGALYLLEFISKEEYYLAYLPLAHILEFVVENACLFLGICLGYGSVRTLTDASVRNCYGDIKELRPTLMAGVPAVWETIRKGILAKLREASPAQQRIFELACNLKWTLLTLGLPTSLLDKLVFNRIKEQTGGRLKFALSGGAPIPRTSQKFLSVCICPLVNGYGMTECCAVVAVQSIDISARVGIVGPPVPSMEIKLVDVPDTSYSSKNRPRPQGEIWVRGASVMKGYYRQPQLTSEVLTEDGWLMTGDIGEWQPDGCLSVIDRKKNLVKLANGEYIALEKLESIYKTSPYVANIIVYGDSEQYFPVAIIMATEKELHHLAKEKNIFPDPDSVELQELADNKAIKAA